MRASDFPQKRIRDKKVIAVCCGSNPLNRDTEIAYEVGREIARRGAILVCGGLGGSMEAACRGCKDEGGMTIGIIPFYEKETANEFVDIVIPTGIGHARNIIVAASGDGVIGVGGSWGTLNELSIAYKMGKPVVTLGGWDVRDPEDSSSGFFIAKTAYEAVAVALGEDPKSIKIEE
ncbi:MAG: TIGR00725 family protein [bacterium]|nr:TIGR00725 family protein [bacterium]